ncbi:MAG: tetratricopeptide repeat protein [Lepagella sp.]
MKRLLYILILLSVVSIVLHAMTPEMRRSYEAFEQRAESGDAEALYRLALILEKGYDTIPADTLRAISLLRRSASLRYAPACNYLGYLYQRGDMIEANLDSAIHYIRIATAAGDARADHNLAYLLMNDSAATAILAPHNDKDAIDSLALHHLRRASDAGLPAAMTLLADCYAAGHLVDKDTLQALDLYHRAISRDFGDARLRLLNMMWDKWRVLPSYELFDTAVGYWEEGESFIATTLIIQLTSRINPMTLLSMPEIGDTIATQKGEIEREKLGRAYAILGYAYSRGEGVKYDYQLANRFMAYAAILGDPAACSIMAETLEIFPDALQQMADSLPESLQIDRLRAQGRRSGIDTAEKALQILSSR